MRRELPAGTVTFLFTDVEGSTKLLHALGADAYADALAEHRRILREAVARHDGVEVDTQGDAFFVAFPTAPQALAAAIEATEALTSGEIRVRIGLHTGTPLLSDEGYIGPDVHKGARIGAAGHGGQILVSAATAALLDGVDLRDLGLHRLKDLTAPERIYQADPGEHPPLKTLHRTNLPLPATPFLGRQAELADVTALLVRDDVRLLTLTGPGGMGKTRLALQAAADAADHFPDGVWWVPLAATDDSALVLGEIERAIGGRPPLAEHIGDRKLLIVLDNFEQLLDAGPTVARLVAACPNLKVVVTSRAVLEVRGEREFRVPPLAVAQAVALFAERASHAPDADVQEVCLRLDCLPLAVELAAARARHLSASQMLERIGARLDLFRGARDADPRHATLRATIDWSHRLLSPEEQGLFARLAAFRGGWSLEAAEVVADADLDALGSLVDKSLVVRDGERFAMLETIREFAQERFAESPDATTVRERHLHFVIDMAERWYDDRHAAPTRWFAAVDAESDNIRQALDFAATREGPEEQRLIGAVAIFWAMHGYGAELLTRLRAAVARRNASDVWRGRALMHLGGHTDDVAMLVEARELLAKGGDRSGEADALEQLGWVHDANGEYSSAQPAYEASLAIRSAIGSPEADSLGARAGLCHVFVAQGDVASARHLAEELLGAARRVRTALMEELALHFIADCALIDGRYADAERDYLVALGFARDAGLVSRATDEVEGIAMAYAGQGRHEEAVRLSAVANAKQVEIGKGSDFWWDQMQERLLGGARAAVGDERSAAAEERPGEASFDELVDTLLARRAPAAQDAAPDFSVGAGPAMPYAPRSLL